MVETPYLVRRANAHDIPRMSELASDNLREQYSLEFFKAIIDAWPDGCLVIEHEEIMLAFITGALMKGSTARILMLTVDTAYRRKHLGSMLLKQFIHNALRASNYRVTLEVRLSNKEAQRFYESHGFMKLTIIDNYYNDGEAGYRMDRTIV